jgi:hypothetical protein
MLTPQELYETYSVSPCTSFLPSPYSQLSHGDVYNQLGANDFGAGTPMNWARIINFFKHVKYPCLESAPGYDDILNTGKNKLSPTFKFLQLLDIEAYKEQQPTVRAGTAYAVRNACDLSRACKYTYDDTTTKWQHRMATEYLEYFGHQSLPDCLMLCGPDLVPNVVAKHYRGQGFTVGDNEPLPADDPDGRMREIATGFPGMECFCRAPKGVSGAAHSCISPPMSDEVFCGSCDFCTEDSGPDDPCCSPGTILYANSCCGGSYTDRLDFSLWIKSDDGRFDGTILNGRVGEVLKHVGILERKLYHGYANFTNQCSGVEPPICLDDIFLNYFHNNTTTIEKAHTISMVLKCGVSNNAGVSTDTNWMVDRIKDLLYNGYGVMLLTNVGFNNLRDSTGISYPDRIFYHTYNIIGYDDTKINYDECVYVLHIPFGEWNSGGHPSWGPLPTGSFLVTESHLRCLIQHYPTSDFYDCRKKPCMPPKDCTNLSPSDRLELNGCGAGLEGRCDPFYCTPQQKACGFVIAVSLNDGFTKQPLNYNAFFPIANWKEILKAQKLYYKPSV